MKPILIIFALFLQLFGCQSNKSNKNTDTMSTEEFEWADCISVPIGYPVRLFAGDFGSPMLYSTRNDSWGNGIGMSSSKRPIPRELDIAWLSYAENCFYRVKTPIDYKKIVPLFREGYDERVPKGEIWHSNYDKIIAGLAPGGVVILWIAGSDKQVEIGRYQAEKIEIEEPEGLDSHEQLMFSDKHRKEIMEKESVIPKEVQEANKNKPIPYGLWDSYRDIQYHWYPTFELQNGKMGDIRFWYRNGEELATFYTDLEMVNNPQLQSQLFYPKSADILPKKYSLPRRIIFSYKAHDGLKYSANCEFYWEEITKAFREVVGDNPENISVQLAFRVNYHNTHFSVRVIGSNGKEIFIEPKDIEIFKISDILQKYGTPHE